MIKSSMFVVIALMSVQARAAGYVSQEKPTKITVRASEVLFPKLQQYICKLPGRVLNAGLSDFRRSEVDLKVIATSLIEAAEFVLKGSLLQMPTKETDPIVIRFMDGEVEKAFNVNGPVVCTLNPLST